MDAFHLFNSDVLVQVISYLNIQESGRLASTSRRFCYLVDQFQGKVLGPELVTSKSYHEDDDDDDDDNDNNGITTASTTKTKKKKRKKKNVTAQECCRKAMSKLRSKPNLGIVFSQNEDMAEPLHAALPEDSAMVGVTSNLGIQATSIGDTGHHHHHQAVVVECKSSHMAMLASFSKDSSSFVPFVFQNDNNNNDHHEQQQQQQQQHGGGGHDDDEELMEQLLIRRTPNGMSPTNYWKVMLVYVTNNADVSAAEYFIDQLQRNHPEAAIVGGVCRSGFLRLSEPATTREALRAMTMDELKHYILDRRNGIEEEVSNDDDDDGRTVRNTRQELHRFSAFLDYSSTSSSSGSKNLDRITDREQLEKLAWSLSKMRIVRQGIFGLALGGDIPVRTIVSRGVRSCTNGSVGEQDSFLRVAETSLVQPYEESYPFLGDPNVECLPPIHMIRRLHDVSTGEYFDATKWINSIASHVWRHELAELFVGIERHGKDGYVLVGPRDWRREVRSLENICIYVDNDEEEESMLNAKIDLFSVEGKACRDDLDLKLASLRKFTENEQILGGMMISCCGRGPSGSLMGEEMSDARSFHRHFPGVPCLGFYAGGEIGPQALAGNKNVFQRGRVAMQGYTAVFALFIVPKMKPGLHLLDDSDANIARHIQQRMQSSSVS